MLASAHPSVNDGVGCGGCRLPLHVGDDVGVHVAERGDAVAACSAISAGLSWPSRARERVPQVIRTRTAVGARCPSATHPIDRFTAHAFLQVSKPRSGRGGVEDTAAPVAVIGVAQGLPSGRENNNAFGARLPVASMYSARSCRSGASSSIDRDGRSTFCPATITQSTSSARRAASLAQHAEPRARGRPRGRVPAEASTLART